MTQDTLLLYVGTMVLVVLIPGPTVLCVVTQAGRYGFRRSLAGIAGVQVGHLILFGFVAAGLATALATHSRVLELIRLLGAGYLIFLGLRLVFARPGPRAELITTGPSHVKTRDLLLQALATQVSNPKAYLFVSAYLPQFIRSEQPLLPQIAILFVVTVAVETSVLLGYAYLTARSVSTIRHSAAGPWLERALGGAFLFFGVRMLVDRK